MEATRCRTAPLARRQEDGRGSAERKGGRGRGCLGAAPGEAGRIDDGAARGYFDERLRVQTVHERSLLGVRSFARRVMTEVSASFSKESCYLQDFLAPARTYARVAKLI